MKKPDQSQPLAKIAADLDRLLNHAAINDWPQAMNGLQVENSGQVRRIGAAVDACETTFAEAARRGIDLLLVHHGLFWTPIAPVTKASYRKLKLALDADMAVYSSHLPLDLHPKLGNNAQLARALGFKKPSPFLEEKGAPIGFKARLSLHRDELAEKLRAIVGGPVKLIPGGPERTRMVGVVSGGAGDEVAKAAAEGVDTYITGEGQHWTHAMAEELGINLLYAGHYATETFGIKALAAHVSKKYRLPWEFIDHPTGL